MSIKAKVYIYNCY